MIPGELLLLFFLSAAGAWLGGFLVYGILARLHILDVPNARSSHDRVVVRGGGAAILLVLVIVWAAGASFDLAWLQWDNRILLAVLLVAGISFADDIRSLAYPVRLLIHGLAAGLLLSGLSAAGPLSATAAVTAWLWLVGYANAFNFMDGINGLATFQVLLTGLFGALFCWIEAANHQSADSWIAFQILLGGSALGFLPHNFPKARMFLGDIGSVTMGFLLAVFVLAVWQTAGWKAGIALGALHFNFLLDTSITMVRRYLRGERLHQAHREHFYQRLLRSGASHTAVTLWETCLQVAAGLALIGALRLPAVLFVTAVLTILSCWLIFFGFCERRFRNSSGLEPPRPVPPGS